MTEERLKVLEILQEGKIGAKDAARLLEALNKTSTDEDDEGVEAEIDEEIDELGDNAVKMKIKVKTHQDEDA